MAENGAVSAKQRRFVAALMTSRTVADACQVAGIGQRTGSRYLADPEVRKAIAEAQAQALAAVTSRAVDAMTGALATLEALHQDPETPAAVQCSAARAILEYGPRLRDLVTVDERLAALEERLQ